LRKEKDSLYSQIIDIRKKVEEAESAGSCIDKLLKENRGLTQVLINAKIIPNSMRVSLMKIIRERCMKNNFLKICNLHLKLAARE